MDHSVKTNSKTPSKYFNKKILQDTKNFILIVNLLFFRNITNFYKQIVSTSQLRRNEAFKLLSLSRKHFLEARTFYNFVLFRFFDQILQILKELIRFSVLFIFSF